MGPVVTHSLPTFEVSGSNPRPYVAKLVVCLPMVGSLQHSYFTFTKLNKSLVASNLLHLQYFVTSAKEVIFWSGFVCGFVSLCICEFVLITQKPMNGF